MSFLSSLDGSQGTRIFLGFCYILLVVSPHTGPLLSLASPVDGLQTCCILDKHVELKMLKICLHTLFLKEQSCFPEVDLIIGLCDPARSPSLSPCISCSFPQSGSVLLARFQSSLQPVAKGHFRVHKGLNLLQLGERLLGQVLKLLYKRLSSFHFSAIFSKKNVFWFFICKR